jgi:SAM-dependent methyltransferase
LRQRRLWEALVAALQHAMRTQKRAPTAATASTRAHHRAMTARDREDSPAGADDVPIRVDFRDPATARTWIEETRIERPYRPRFFSAFCAALASRSQVRILELGSGPGQLAREILVHCDVQSYVALDFSPAMHELAAEHLGELAERIGFVVRDFREPSWPRDLGTFDAVVTLQAAHETRHKRHLVPLLERARTVLVPKGVLLCADHYLTPEMTLRALLPAREDQPLALERAGFTDVELRYEEGNMALWCGTNPAS